jgi:hypothetical protein
LMSSIPQDLLTGSSQRRWLRLDLPELGHLSNQEASDSPQASDKPAVAESIDRTTPAHRHQEHKSPGQDGLDVDSGDAG